MTQYRIIEDNGLFYPQERFLFWWYYLDNKEESITWDNSCKRNSKCLSLEEANSVIKSRISYLKPKLIIHKYKE